MTREYEMKRSETWLPVSVEEESGGRQDVERTVLRPWLEQFDRNRREIRNSDGFAERIGSFDGDMDWMLDSAFAKLYEVDPYHVWATWNIRQSEIEAVRNQAGWDFDGSTLVLRIYDITCIEWNGLNAHRIFDFDIHELHGHRNLKLHEFDKSFVAEVGFRLRNGRFCPMVRSNACHTPRKGPSTRRSRAALWVQGRYNRVHPVNDLSDQHIFYRPGAFGRLPHTTTAGAGPAVANLAVFAWETMYSLATGPACVHLSETLNNLKNRAAGVHVFTRLPSAEHPHRRVIDGVHYHFVPLDPSGVTLSEAESLAHNLRDRFYTLEREIGEFEIVHVHDWMMIPSLLAVNERKYHRSVLSFHGLERDVSWNGPLSGRVQEIEKAGCNHARRILVGNERHLEMLFQNYCVPANKLHVLPEYGLPADKLLTGGSCEKLGIPSGDRILLFIGALDYRFGPDLALEAFARIRDEYPDLKMLLIGDGGFGDELRRAAHHRGVADRTLFAGNVTGQTMLDAVSAASVIVIPHRERILDAAGIAALGWKYARPVVATFETANEFVWHEVNGIKVYANPDSIAWGVRRVLGDEYWTEKVVRAARHGFKQLFSWQAISERIAGVYRDVRKD